MQQKVQFIADAAARSRPRDPRRAVQRTRSDQRAGAQGRRRSSSSARGKTVIFSTHVMDNAEKMCDSVCIIARGEKVLDGTRRRREASSGRAERRAVARRRRAERRRARCSATRSSSRKVDDNNRFFELELAPGADPQVLLRRLHRGRRAASSASSWCSRRSIRSSFNASAPQGIETGMSGHG